MRSGRTAQNSVLAMLQVAVSGVVLFLLYRYLLTALGPVELGAWSLVLATSSVSRLAELGVGGGVLRFVSMHRAAGAPAQAWAVVETASTSLALTMGGAMLVARFPLEWLLARLLPREVIHMALPLLPYALAILWTGYLNGVFQSGLDACQRTDLKSLVNIAGSVLWLALALAWVPRAGLLGLAQAQLAQALAMTALTWLLLRRQLPDAPLIPYRWHRSTFGEILRYGISFQAVALLGLLYDPATKLLLGRFGDLSQVTFYDMANRLIMQFRGLLTAPGQVLAALVAGPSAQDAAGLRQVYRNAFAMQAFLSLPLYAGITAALPWVGEVWIGGWQPLFLVFGLLICIGWFLNGFANPAYFANLGLGELRGNLVAHLVIGIGNLILGAIGGDLLGGTGVVLGAVVALIAGSSLLPLQFQRRHHLTWGEVLPLGQRGAILGCLIGVAGTWLLYPLIPDAWRPIGLIALSLTAYLIPAGVAAWRSPMRRRVLELAFRSPAERMVSQ